MNMNSLKPRHKIKHFDDLRNSQECFDVIAPPGHVNTFAGYGFGESFVNGNIILRRLIPEDDHSSNI